MEKPITGLEALATLRSTIDLEIKALHLLRDQFDDTWSSALDLLFACTGKVVVSGIGKSGIIARKIAATLASTGTPAFFLHPAEALQNT